MPETLPSLIGVPRIREGGDNTEKIRWAGKKQCLDIAAVERLDNSREEVGDGSCRDVTEQHEELGLG